MLGKLAGGAFIVAATSKIGFDAASKYEKRVKDLKAFQSGLWLLKNEIDFSMTMLSFALKKCAGLLQENVSSVFCLTASYIDNGSSVNKAWCCALDSLKTDLYLNDEDIAVLKDFAAKLGCGDADAEKNNIEKTMERLHINEENAVYNCGKYSRMCKTIGITAGLMLVIILM